MIDEAAFNLTASVYAVQALFLTDGSTEAGGG